jgi:hypothetical protein
MTLLRRGFAGQTDLDGWARSLGWASCVERQDAIAANEARYARGLAWQQEHAAELRLAQGHRRPAASSAEMETPA